MIKYSTYVKVSVEGMIYALEEKLSGADEARRQEIEREKRSLEEAFQRIIEIAAGIPPFPEALHSEIFPRRNFQGDIYLGIRPNDVSGAVYFLDLLTAYPVAHKEGDRTVVPWTAAGDLHRIFPYTIRAHITEKIECWLTWTYEYGRGNFVTVRMRLPDSLAEKAVDGEAERFMDCLFIVGLVPYFFVRTDEDGKQLGLRFPKAYVPSGEEGFRLLTWRDIPLFREAALAIEKQDSQIQ